MRTLFTKLLTVGLMLSIWAQTALAVDGVIELNQACVASGCLAGDSPGFPIEIKQKGSYRLTGNLLLPDKDTTAILVISSYVTIDLNGFTIEGVTRCSGTPVVCTDTGIGRGVAIDLTAVPLPFSTSVHNGHIFGMGSYGVLVLLTSNIKDVHVQQCGEHGMFAGELSEVSGSSALHNGGDGIQAGVDSFVNGNRSSFNGGGGFKINGSASVTNNTASSNAEYGFFLGSNSVAHNNSSTGNQDSGFVSGLGVVFRGNSANFNTVSGFNAGIGNLLESNVARSNSGTGLMLDVQTIYRGNSMTQNGTLPVTGGVNGGGNYCNGTGTINPTCP